MKRSAHSARYIFRARALLLTLVRGTQESPVIFACYEARLHSGVAKTPAQAPMSHAAGDPSGPKAIRTSAFDSTGGSLITASRKIASRAGGRGLS
jgi:hypothetical protein